MSKIDPLKKVLYWCVASDGLSILIPKKRQAGFLRQPVGHHVNALSQFVLDELNMDCCGLDGFLHLDISDTSPLSKEVKECVDKISEFYGIPSEQVSHSEFFDYLLNRYK